MHNLVQALENQTMDEILKKNSREIKNCDRQSRGSKTAALGICSAGEKCISFLWSRVKNDLTFKHKVRYQITAADADKPRH